MPLPWERQEWESATGYARFRDFYLPLVEPRSLDAAYRNYLEQYKGRPPDPSKKASGSWRAWHQARDGKDQKIPGAMTWPERAEAWDNHQASLRWARRQQKVLRYEDRALDAVEAGINRVLEMLAFPLDEEIVEVDRHGEIEEVIIRPARWDYNAIARLLPALDRLARMITKEPTERIETTGTGRPGQVYEALPDEEINERIERLMAWTGQTPEDPTSTAPGD